MKKILTILMVLLLAPAAYAGDFKIGIVDFQKALNESEFGAKTRTELESKIRARQMEFDQKIQKRDQMRQELEAQASVLSEEAYRQRAEDLEKYERDLEREVNDSNEEFGKLQRQKEVGILKELDTLVRTIAEKGDYDLILPVDVVVFSKDGHDITDEVIEQYNRMKKSEGNGGSSGGKK